MKMMPPTPDYDDADGQHDPYVSAMLCRRHKKYMYYCFQYLCKVHYLYNNYTSMAGVPGLARALDKVLFPTKRYWYFSSFSMKCFGYSLEVSSRVASTDYLQHSFLWRNKIYMSQCMTKPTKWHVHPAKTQISLGIRPV